MKKVIILVLAIIILTGCNTATLSFSEVENLPKNVQDHVDANLKLQSITDEPKAYYIVFHSHKKVEADLESVGKTVTVKFNETGEEQETLEQYTFYLTTDEEHDTIDVLINGESTAFDNMTIH